MRRRSDVSPWTMVVAMIVASVGVHLVLWPVGDRVLSVSWTSPPLPPAGGIMEVSLLGADEDEPPEAEDAVPPPPLPGQLVRPDFVPDPRKPDQSTRVSEFDSRVRKETKAPSRRRAERYDPRQRGEQSGVSSASSGATAQDVPTHALPLGRLDPGRSEERERLGAGERPSASTGREGLRATAPRPGFRGNTEAMRRTFGGSGSFDHLPDVEEGTENLLNTDRFRFASFFNRMRDQIRPHWDPNGVMERIDPDGRVYGRRTRKTLLHIRLTPEGAVKKIFTQGDSGVIELDREAIQAIHRGAPFVNPPPQMIDPTTGFIEVDFMFILDEGGGPRIRRYLR